MTAVAENIGNQAGDSLDDFYIRLPNVVLNPGDLGFVIVSDQASDFVVDAVNKQRRVFAQPRVNRDGYYSGEFLRNPADMFSGDGYKLPWVKGGEVASAVLSAGSLNPNNSPEARKIAAKLSTDLGTVALGIMGHFTWNSRIFTATPGKHDSPLWFWLDATVQTALKNRTHTANRQIVLGDNE